MSGKPTDGSAETQPRVPSHAYDATSAIASHGSVASAALAARIIALSKSLDVALDSSKNARLGPGERAALKESIAGLFREADAALREATVLKDAVRSLAESWKKLDSEASAGERSSVQGGSGRGVTGNTGQAPTELRADHLGASTYIEKGWSCLALDQAEEAEQALRLALSLSPGSTEATTLLAWSQALRGLHEDALQTLIPVLGHDPSVPLAQVIVAYVDMREGRYEDSGRRLQQVTQSGRDRRAILYAWLYTGMLHGLKREQPQAVHAFGRALELGPNLIQAWFELGGMCWRNGDRAGALDAWQRGAQTNRFSPWGKRCGDLAATVEAGGEPELNG